jgi:hypothetical protein
MSKREFERFKALFPVATCAEGGLDKPESISMLRRACPEQGRRAQYKQGSFRLLR